MGSRYKVAVARDPATGTLEGAAPTSSTPGGGEERRAPAVPERDPLIGTTLVGKYRIEGLLGRGAMGRVYRAHHLDLDAAVAVKLMRPDRAANRESVARFRQEARATSRLRHPNVITILDFGQTESGQFYLVTEVLTGRTLARVLEEEAPLGPQRVVRLLGQALSALDAAHALGVIHRDFKPENILVTRLRGEEHVKVLDFGLAQLVEGPTATTAGNNVSGTPDYMSPEQIRGETIDARSDLYSAGVVLYELLTEMQPYKGDLLAVLSGHLHHPPEPPQLRRMDRAIVPALEAVCLRAMSKDRSLRFGAAAEMRAALEAAVDDARVRCTGCGVQVSAAAVDCPECGAAMAHRTLGGGVELPPRFVGREEELARLIATTSGAARVLGRAGSGRTRLVDELRRRLEQEGGWVVTLRPDPSGARRSWLPVRRALAAVYGVVERATADELRAACWERPQDVPGLFEVFGLDAEGAIPLEEVALRRREGLAAAVSSLRDAEATILCEDVDRFDPLSTLVVERLLRDPGERRIVATATDVAPIEGGEELRLVPLGLGAQAALGVSLSPSHAWPLEIEQHLRSRAEAAPEATPASRLSVLPPTARRVMAAAVISGSEVEIELLADITGQDPVPSLGLLAARGLVRLAPGPGDGRVILPSLTLRDALYASLDGAERSGYHLVLREALEKRDADPTLLAHHEWLAASSEASLAILERAAEACTRALDDEGAARWYHRARARAQRTGDDHLAAPLSLALGNALSRAGDVVGAVEALHAVILAAPGNLPLLADAHHQLGRLAIEQGDRATAVSELDHAITAALGTENARLAATMYLELATLFSEDDRPGDAARALRRAIPLATNLPDLAARLVLATALGCKRSGRLDEAARLAAEALLIPELPASERARAHALIAEAARATDIELAAAHRRAALDELRRLGDRRGVAQLLHDAAALDARDTLTAKRWLLEAAELARQVEWNEGLALIREALRPLDVDTP